MPKRSITDQEIGLIRAMLARGMKNRDIQFYFNRQDRPVNSGRITQIRGVSYGPEVPQASETELDTFLSGFTPSEIGAVVGSLIPSRRRTCAGSKTPMKGSRRRAGSSKRWCQIRKARRGPTPDGPTRNETVPHPHTPGVGRTGGAGGANPDPTSPPPLLPLGVGGGGGDEAKENKIPGGGRGLWSRATDAG